MRRPERDPPGAPRVRESEAPRPPPPTPEYFDRGPGWVRLDNNTSPRPNPAVRAAGAIARAAELNRYGTAWGARLIDALAQYYDRTPEGFLVGNGSDEILDAAARAFLGPGRTAAMVRPGYDLYAALAYRAGGRLREAYRNDRMEPLEGWSWAREVDLLFLGAPDNPTGRGLLPQELSDAAAAVRGIVVVDEAYAEYAGSDLWTEGLRHPNVLFTRTFSKAWGLAGLRVGYGIGPPALVRTVQRYRVPFTLGTLPEEIARRALADPGFLAARVRAVRRERPRLAAMLTDRGFRVLPSEANFLLVDPPVEGGHLFDRLRERKVLVRRILPRPGGRTWLRITVGSPAETRSLQRALDAVGVVPRRARERSRASARSVGGRR